MKPIVIASSTTEPITLEEAVQNLRANSSGSTAEEALITRLIKVARIACEHETELSLVEKTLQISLHSFYPNEIELPLGPVREVVSVTYKDDDGDDVVLDSDQYRIVRNDAGVPHLVTAYDINWPTSVRYDADSVRIRYTVGYPSTDSPTETAPENILQAMHLLIAHYYDNRGAVDENNLAELPLGVRHLLGPDRQGLGV